MVQERACASVGATELGREKRRRRKECVGEGESLWGATMPHCDSQSALQVRVGAMFGFLVVQGSVACNGGWAGGASACLIWERPCTAAQLGVVDDEWTWAGWAEVARSSLDLSSPLSSWPSGTGWLPCFHDVIASRWAETQSVEAQAHRRRSEGRVPWFLLLSACWCAMALRVYVGSLSRLGKGEVGGGSW